MERNFNAAFNHIINYISVSPYLYRYENNKYIDAFFEKGELYISSFDNYKKYTDNELGDKSEGSTVNTGIANNKMGFTALTTIGFNEYTFCTSTILDKNLLAKFSRESAFRIKDPINFILEVTRSLTRVIEVYHGNCIYLNEKIISKKIPNFEIDDLKHDESGISFKKVTDLLSYVQGCDDYFIKKREYQHQAEYRIVWKTDRELTNGIVINCPEAIKFCERVSDDEI
jgi:hypothetical protein